MLSELAIHLEHEYQQFHMQAKTYLSHVVLNDFASNDSRHGASGVCSRQKTFPHNRVCQGSSGARQNDRSTIDSLLRSIAEDLTRSCCPLAEKASSLNPSWESVDLVGRLSNARNSLQVLVMASASLTSAHSEYSVRIMRSINPEKQGKHKLSSGIQRSIGLNSSPP